MRNARKINEVIGSWLHYEFLCGREELFSEKYLSYPIGQYLRNKFSHDLKVEYPHPLLNRGGRGDKKRIDFAVVEEGEKIKVAIETKWVNGQSTASLISSIIKDIIRLELLSNAYKADCFMILAGKKRDMDLLFLDSKFSGAPGHENSRQLLPTVELPDPNALLRLYPTPKYREGLFKDVFSTYLGIEIAQSIKLRVTPRFPTTARAQQYVAIGWRVDSFKSDRRKTFIPE